MNNLTMNKFQSIVYFAIILIHLLPFITNPVDSTQVKFSWFWAQEVFHKFFHLIFLRYLVIQSILKWKSLGARFGEYGGWGRTDQPKSNIFYWMILAKCGLALSWRSSTFLLLIIMGHFLRRFLCTCCSSWKYTSALSVWFWFKYSKWITSWWSHHIHCITFLLQSSVLLLVYLS